MANIAINLPAPAANGAGAWIDVSTMGGIKTIVVGGSTKGTINIEMSNEAVPTKGAPVATIYNRGKTMAVIAAQFMRAVVSNYKGGGAPDIEIGATDDGALFASLPAPAATGVGASVDISSLGPYKTVTIGGPFRGTVIVEVSEDNSQWGQSFSFTNPGQQSKTVVAQYARVRRVGVPLVSPGLPIVDIGGVNPPSGGGGGGLVDPELVTYVCTGAEGTQIVVPITVRATKSYYVGFLSQSVVAQQTAKPVTDIPNNLKNFADFTANLDAAVAAGDTYTFLVTD